MLREKIFDGDLEFVDSCVDRCRFVVPLAERCRVFDTKVRRPPIDQKLRVRSPHAEILFVRIRNQFRFPPHRAPQDRVDQGAALRSGELDRFVNRRVLRRPEEKKLIDSQTQQITRILIEYLRSDQYRFVPGVGIGSRGPVASVALFTRRPVNEIRHIALDTSSRTSVTLIRVLCSERFKIAPEFVPHGPDLAAMVRDYDAGLLIGDPALEADPNRVATDSPAVVTDLLKQQLGFKGLVVTDALDMGALTRLYANNIGRAAVDAFKAGNDMLLIPADLQASYDAMLQAVRSGEIPSDRVDASVLKVLKAKASLGLQRARLVDVDAVAKLVDKPANLATGQQVADDAVTLVRDNGKLLPLKQQGTVASGLPYQTIEEVHNRLVAVIFSDDMRLESGRVFERQLRARVPDANITYVDPRTAAATSDEVLKAVDQAQGVIAAVYVIPTAGKVAQAANGALQNSVAMADASGSLLQKVLEHAAEKTAVIAMGNPYLASDFPAIQTYICTFSNAPVSEISAVKSLFGEIPLRGHLPVTIPNIAQRGAGIERQPLTARGGPNHAQSQSSLQ